MKKFIFVAFSTLASTSVFASPILLWKADSDSCESDGDGGLVKCKEVTLPLFVEGEIQGDYKGISFLPEPVSVTSSALIRDLTFRTLVQYSAKCAGSSVGFQSSLSYGGEVANVKFRTPSDLIEFQTPFSDESSTKVEPIFYLRSSAVASVVLPGCQIERTSVDTLPDSKSMNFITRHVNLMAKSSSSLVKSLDQLGKITNVNDAKDAVSEAIDRFDRVIQSNDEKVVELKDELPTLEDEFEKELKTQEISALESIVADDRATLVKLQDAETNLGVSCTGNEETCKSAVDALGKLLRDDIEAIQKDLKSIHDWVKLEKARLDLKLADSTGKLAAMKAALEKLELLLAEKQKEAAGTVVTAASPVVSPAPVTP